MVKSPSNYCNNAILIRNNDIVKKTQDNKSFKILTKRERRFENNQLYSNDINLGISNYNLNDKKRDENISIYENCTFENKNIHKNNKKEDKYKKTIFPCSKIVDFEIKNNNNDNKKINNNKNISICSKVSTFEIKNNINNIMYRENKFSKNIYLCSNTSNFEVKNNINKITNRNIQNKKENKISIDTSQTSLNQNSRELNISPRNNIYQNIPSKDHNHQNIIKSNNSNQIICPYDPKNYPPIEKIYNAYLKTVNDDIKISFKIIPDIYYYSTIGVSPKIILFKEKNSNIYGIATLSYDPTKLFHRALMITSISCSNKFSITNTLLQLVSYCDKEIEYDELILSLYFYQSETEKDKYLLNEEYKDMIKTKTKFRWTALENTGNERKIKYNYKKSFDSNKKILIKNNEPIKMVKNYIQTRFYRFIKYNKTHCDKGLNAKDYTFLFNVIDLIIKYGKDPNNKDDELNFIFTKVSGLKKKRLIKMISEFNFVIYNKVNAFIEELGINEDKKFSEILFRKFIPFVENIEKDLFLGLYYCDISANFSSIFKKRINGYEDYQMKKIMMTIIIFYIFLNQKMKVYLLYYMN